MNTIKLNTIGEGPITKPSSEGGGGDWVYYDVSMLSSDEKNDTLLISLLSKVRFADDLVEIIYSVEAKAEEFFDKLIAVATCKNGKIYTEGEWRSTDDDIRDSIVNYGAKEITKEEFYAI